MEIKKALGELTKPEKYVPTLVGGLGGVLGSIWVLDQLKAVSIPYGDAGDWLVKGGFTAVAAVGMMSTKPSESDAVKTVIHTALLTAAVTGAIVLAIKVMPSLGPVAIGRAGVSPGYARSGVSVVAKPATPTYAQGTPVVAPERASVY